MFFIKIYIKESYKNYYYTIIQMCGQYCILAPILGQKILLTKLFFKTFQSCFVLIYGITTTLKYTQDFL